MITIRHAYDPPVPGEGERYLVDRLWPRGLRKENLKLAGWMKDASPSTELRKWYNHDPERWDEFRRRYTAELDENPQAWQALLAAARAGDIVLLYGAREPRYNNAAALKEYLEKHLEGK